MKGLDPQNPLLLRHPRDLQSLVYLAAAPALAAWMWTHGWNAWLYTVMIMAWIGVGVIHHHHAHLPMWRARRMNRWTDLWLAALQGHPTYAFVATHNANHHRHRHGPGDWARTYRFWGGDTNHALGYLLHPFQAAWALYPHFWAHLMRARQHRNGLWRWALIQYGLVLAVWAVALSIDPSKAFWYVLLPQVVAMHWLLGANYFQHAHADGLSRWNYARNFTGFLNTIYFNIGYHTAHHEHPRAHWSTMPALHAALEQRVDARLLETSFARYVCRVMVLSLCVPRWRSRSMMSMSENR